MKLKALEQLLLPWLPVVLPQRKQISFKKMEQVLLSLLPCTTPGSTMAQETGNQVNYQAVGSGAGVRQFTAKTVTSVPVMVL